MQVVCACIAQAAVAASRFARGRGHFGDVLERADAVVVETREDLVDASLDGFELVRDLGQVVLLGGEGHRLPCRGADDVHRSRLHLPEVLVPGNATVLHALHQNGGVASPGSSRVERPILDPLGEVRRRHELEHVAGTHGPGQAKALSRGAAQRVAHLASGLAGDHDRAFRTHCGSPRGSRRALAGVR